MKEIWKDVDGYEGLYQVSNLGRVKSLSRLCKSNNNNYRPIKERQLKDVSASGYRRVGLCRSHKRRHFTVHRLVAIAFIENPQNKPQVNHIDGDKSNNKASNLEWATAMENQAHAYLFGLRDSAQGESNISSKLKDSDIVTIRKRILNGDKSCDIAKDYNMHRDSIGSIKTRKTWCHII